MLKSVGLSLKRVAVGVMQYPVKQCCGKHRIPNHLSPVGYLFVGRKDDGGGFVCVTDKGKESVGLASGNRCVSYLIDDYQLSLLEVLKPETCGTLCFCIIKDLNKVDHLLEADGIAAVDGVKPSTNSHHSFSKTRRSSKDNVSAVIEPGEFLEFINLSLRYPGIKLVGIEFLY